MKPSPELLQPPTPPVPPAERPGQFSISALMIATAIAAALLGAARLYFNADWEIVHWLLAPLFLIGVIYICLRLPFILTAIGRQRDYYRALQRYRQELAEWIRERKASRTGDDHGRPN